MAGSISDAHIITQTRADSRCYIPRSKRLTWFYMKNSHVSPMPQMIDRVYHRRGNSNYFYLLIDHG